jgi:hypothetical protein
MSWQPIFRQSALFVYENTPKPSLHSELSVGAHRSPHSSSDGRRHVAA